MRFLFYILCVVIMVSPSFSGGGDLRAGLLDHEGGDGVALSPLACGGQARGGDASQNDRASVASARGTTSIGSKAKGQAGDLRLVVDKEADAAVHKLRGLMQRFNQSGLAEADFWVALSSLFEKRRGNAAISGLTQQVLDCAAVGSAVLAGGAVGEIIMFNGGVGSVLGVSPDYDSNTPPYQNVVAGVVLGAASIPENYVTLESVFKWLGRRSDQYAVLAQPNGLTDSLLGRLVLPVGVGGLVGKTVYAYIVTNSVDMTPGITAAAVVMGIPWATVLTWRAKTVMGKGLTKLAFLTNAFWANHHKEIQVGVGDREALRKGWANSFRRVKASAHDASALWDVIEAIRTTVNEKTQVFGEAISALKKQASEAAGAERRVLEKQIVGLREQRRGLERVETLLTLKALWDFDKDGDFAREPQEATLGSKFYGRHPLWYEGTRMAGRLLGGMACASIWYGWAEIFESMGLGYEGAYFFATLFTMFFTPYGMEKAGDGLARVASQIKGYNPVADEDTIRISTVNHETLRAVIGVISLLKSVPTAWPAALVGGRAMWDGVGPGAGHVPINQQLWTLAPAMGVYAATLDRKSGRRSQGLVTRYMAKHGKDPKAIAQQKVASLLHRVDKWTGTLRGEFAMNLMDRLKQDPSEWFGLPKQEEGKEDWTAYWDDDGMDDVPLGAATSKDGGIDLAVPVKASEAFDDPEAWKQYGVQPEAGASAGVQNGGGDKAATAVAAGGLSKAEKHYVQPNGDGRKGKKGRGGANDNKQDDIELVTGAVGSG